MQRWTIQRPRARRVRPIELWDVALDGAPLYRRVGSERVAALRRDGVPEPQIGRALAADVAAALQIVREAHPFDRVRVDGGLSRLDELRKTLRRGSEVPVTFGRGGRFSAEAGGRRLLARRGLAGGVVLDLGQTAIKASALMAGSARRSLVERDTATLPVEHVEEDRLSDPARQAAYGALVRAAAAALADAAWPPPPPALVLGLPASLDSTGVPGPCTYPGLAGRADFPRALLEAALPRLSSSHPWSRLQGDVFVLDDAELVARAVRARGAETVLSLTLGFGPGGALVSPLAEGR